MPNEMEEDNDKQCEECDLDIAECSCSGNTGKEKKSFKVIHTAIKPPDLCKSKEDLPHYERKLKRWSRSCGIPVGDQGDALFLYPSNTNPTLQDRLDREIGDEIYNNEKCIDIILDTLKSWFGVDKGVDLIKVFNAFVNTKRNANQDYHSYVGEFESKYSDLEKLGEKFSSRLLALFLLKNANLTDVEFQIITANLDFSSEKEAKDQNLNLYQMTKDALNKYQNCRVINSDSCNADSKTLLLNTENLDSLTEEQQNQVVLWANKRKKGDQNMSDDPPYKKWRKCYYCLCKCTPKWKKCDCPCSQHPPWKCPLRKDKKKDDDSTLASTASVSSTDYEKANLNLKNLSGYVNDRLKAIPSQKGKKGGNQEVILINHDVTLLARKGCLISDACENKHQLTIDTACPTTLVGAKYFKKIFKSYPSSVSSQFQKEASNKSFVFGGGETTKSLGKFTIPVYLMDSKNELHMVFIGLEVVEQDIIMLLGANSLTKAEASLDLGQMIMTLPKISQQARFPLRYTNGHFIIPFFSLSKEDGYEAAQIYLTKRNWTEESATSLLNHVGQKGKTTFANVVEDVYHIRGQRKQKKGTSEMLNQKDINKLHHLFGHAHPDKLERLIKASKRWDNTVKEKLNKLLSCEVCKVEGRRIPKPKVALPRAARHNHVVAIDLKENTRYPNALPYILYLVDCFSRFKCATFIPNKKASTVSEAIITNWIKLFGPMAYLHCDRGREWLNQELENVCYKFDIKLTSTAALTPNANGIVERQHAVCDRMMDKMLTADPTLTPDVALGWSVHAANALEMREGISPFMIVFGKNPMHPSLTDYKPGNEENAPELSKVVADNIKAMIKARELFCSLESDRVLRQALKQRIYTNSERVHSGDWIYYRQNNSTVWKGPVKVTTREGKRLYVLNGGRLNTINVDDVLLCKNDEEMWQIDQEEFVTVPVPIDQSLNDDETAEEARLNAYNETAGETFTYSTAPRPIISETCENFSVASEEEQDSTNVEQPVPTAPELEQPLLTGPDDEQSLSTRAEVQSQSTELEDQQPLPTSPDGEQLLEDDQLEIPQRLKPNKKTPYRVSCNSCSKNLSSRSIVTHNVALHGIRGRIESISTPIPEVSDDALDENQGEVIEEVQDGEQIVINEDAQIGETQNGQIFFTSETQMSEDEEVYLTVLPRSRHNDPDSIKAKDKELQDFASFDVYDVVNRPPKMDMISTQWVLVDKENDQGEIKRKARLCMRGDCEKNKHLIPTDSPTVNKVTLKLMLTIAASKGWEISCSDVTRAFLQTEDLRRDIYVIPPIEAKVPANKCWKLKRAAYGLIDASRGFFLNYSKKLQNLGFEALKMDPAAFILKSKGSLEALNACHVDDSIGMATGSKLEEIQKNMSQHFTYGEFKTLPCRYIGSNLAKDDDDIVINQDHYITALEVPDMSKISHLKRDDVLPEKFQSTFRSLASKLNMIAMSSRPDVMFDAKVLTTKYGSATKRDILKVIKIMKHLKEESTTLTIPDIGEPEDWILLGVTDASNKSVRQVFAVSGHVIMLVNKRTNKAAVLTWSSKKIDRVCNSSLAAETLSLQKMAGNMFYIRQMLKQMFGALADKIPGLALTDNQDLYSCVHNLKACEDKRLLADIIGIKQAIADDKTITELRYIPKEVMIADCLTKTGKLGEDLLNVVRTGIYNIPGGVTIRDSTKLNIKTWQQLMQAEEDQ